jgi:oligopeptide/dipeptide ABC transporter ATP-binding protein
MRQRVMIAMALACEPSLLIADEPTTALDVTIQAQILELLAKLKEKMGMSVILITHDLGVVAEVATDVVVMYAGRVVESAPVKRLFAHPRHPYTRGLLQTLPSSETKARARLPVIEGLVPDPFALPPGCRFADRCPMVVTECTKAEPELVAVEPGADEGALAGDADGGGAVHLSRCIRANEV